MLFMHCGCASSWKESRRASGLAHAHRTLSICICVYPRISATSKYNFIAVRMSPNRHKDNSKLMSKGYSRPTRHRLHIL